jgi:hypothetical protein
MAMVAGLTASLLGLVVAVSVGAVPMPLSFSKAKAPKAAALVSSPALHQPRPSLAPYAYGYALAKLPSAQATHHPKPKPTRSVTNTPQPTGAASGSPSSSGLTPQPTAENQTPTGSNELAWSEAILTALGDPLTSANIVSMGYWMQNEAGSPPSGIVGANNPINVSEPGYGGTPIQYEAPGYYLMSYPTVQDGVQATAAYLNNGSYPGILADLQAGTGLNDPNLASELQEYSGGGYSTIPDSWGASQGTPES